MLKIATANGKVSAEGSQSSQANTREGGPNPPMAVIERRDQAQARFLERLATGIPVTVAARLAGVTARAVYLWRDEDPDFAQRMADAREDGLDAIEAQVLSHAKTDWRAGVAYLAAMRPERWSKKVTVEDGPKRHSVVTEDAKRAEELLARLGYRKSDDTPAVLALPGVGSSDPG
jgi:hypothetical protein